MPHRAEGPEVKAADLDVPSLPPPRPPPPPPPPLLPISKSSQYAEGGKEAAAGGTLRLTPASVLMADPVGSVAAVANGECVRTRRPGSFFLCCCTGRYTWAPAWTPDPPASTENWLGYGCRQADSRQVASGHEGREGVGALTLRRGNHDKQRPGGSTCLVPLESNLEKEMKFLASPLVM